MAGTGMARPTRSALMVLMASLLVTLVVAPAARADDSSPVTLSVSVRSAHGATVTSDPPGISCPKVCELSVPAGTQVALTASGAGPGRDFGGWGGACSGTQPTCTFAVTAATRASVTFRMTSHWGDPRQAKSVTDPKKLYGPLKGYTYGPWLDGSKFDGGAEAVASATNVKTGSLSYVSVYRCSVPAGNPEPCVLASSPLTATTLAGQRVYTYLLGRGTGVLRRLTGNPYFYDIIINASDSRDALNIMSQLNRVDR